MSNDPFQSGGDHLPLQSWDTPGTTLTGQILEIRQVQFNDLQSGSPKTWPNGDPKKDWVFDLDTNEDGTADTSVVVAGNLYSKMMEALKEAGVPTVGALVRIKFTELGTPKQKGFNPPKLFEVKAKAGPAIKPKADAFTGGGSLADDEPFVNVHTVTVDGYRNMATTEGWL